MLCITPRTLHCLRREGHFGLLSTFRIVTTVRNVGNTSVEDDKKSTDTFHVLLRSWAWQPKCCKVGVPEEF